MDNKMTEYILKHSRKKDKELKYDFMPSLLEIIERPAHKAGINRLRPAALCGRPQSGLGSASG